MRGLIAVLTAVSYFYQSLAQLDPYEDSPEFCLSPNLQFGKITPRPQGDQLMYHRGSEISFRCDDNYKLQGPPTVRCLSTGKWDPLPLCVRHTASPTRGCTKPKVPYLRTLGQRVKKTRYRSDENIHFQCARGYFLRGPKQAKCLSNGKWDKAPPKCSKVPPFCKYPEELKFGSIQPFQKQYGVGQKVVWKCNINHLLRGAKVSTCTKHGVFSPPKPTCEPVGHETNLLGKQPGGFNLRKLACYAPSLSLGLTLQPKRRFYPVGREIEYSCKQGYHLLGSARAVCTRQGLTSDPPTCKRVECAPPKSPENGQIVGEYKKLYYYGEDVEYVCEKNFLMTGSGHASCQDDGRFVPGPPTCLPPSCRFECDYKEKRPCQCDIGCRYAKNCCSDFEQYCRKLYY